MRVIIFCISLAFTGGLALAATHGPASELSHCAFYVKDAKAVAATHDVCALAKPKNH